MTVPQILSRKQFLGSLALLGAAMALPALADTFPSRPIKLVVPFAPGGNTDVVARLAAQGLTEALGQPVIVENIPGANGSIGASRVATSANDGYTLLFGTAGTQAINPSLYKNQSEKTLDDFEYVALITSIPNVLVVNETKTPVKSVAELVAHAKERRTGLSYGSPGTGSTVHLSGELFKSAAGLDLVHVPYKGSAPAVTDLLGNQIGIMFDNMPSAIQHVRSGKLVPLAVTTAKRSPELPNVPTIAEAGVPGYEATSWFGMLAPAATPAPIVAKLNAALVKVLAQPETKKKINDQGAEAYSETPAEFAAFIQKESVKWGKVVRESGAQAD